MAGLGSLYIDLLARTAGFETDMGRAARIADQRSRAISKTVRQIGIAVASSAAAGVTALAYLSKQAINSADDLSKLSQSTGISTESLSQYAYVADLSGSSIEELSKGLARLQRNASDAARGLETPRRAFDALGISAQNTDGTLKDTEQLMLEVAERFSAIEDGAAKAAVAQELFGRSGVSLIPFLNQGREGIAALTAEADEFGLTVGTEAGRAAEQFNDNLQRLGSVSKGIVNQFAQQMLPMLVTLTDRLVASAKSGGVLDLALQFLVTTFKVIATTGVAVTSVFQQMGRVLLGVGRAALAARGMFSTFSDASDEIKIAFSVARENVTNDIETIARIWSDAVPEFVDATAEIDAALKESIVFGDDGKAAENARKTAESALDSIQKLAIGLEQQIATYGKGEAATIAYRISQGDLVQTFAEAGAAADPYRERLVQLTEQYVLLTEAEKAAAESARQQAEIEAEVAAIIESTRTPFERFTATIERLNELRDTPGSGLDPDTYRRAAEAAQDAFEEATKEVNEFAEQATRNVQDIMARNLRNGFNEGAKGILQSFSDLVSDLVAQALAAKLSQKLFGSEGIGSGGGFLGGIGNTLSSIFGGGRQFGGYAAAGVTYKIHERGPEFFRPKVGGEIIPLSKMSAGAGGVVNQYISVDGRPDTRTAKQLQREAFRQQRIAAARFGA